jgi:hypothetical protein
MTREELVNEIRDALSDACDMDVSWDQYAEAAARMLEKNGVFREWQTIETAPTMKNILLFAVTDRDGDTIKNWKMGTGTKDNEGFWQWNGYNIRAWDNPPTHWMQMPEPPTI